MPTGSTGWSGESSERAMKSRLSKWLKRAGRAVKSAFTGEAKEKKLKERFEEIYAKNEWTHGSGVGSLSVSLSSLTMAWSLSKKTQNSA